SGPRWVQRVLGRWSAYLTGDQPRSIGLQIIAALNLRSYEPIQSLQREAAPAAINWMVTLACNRRCPYCFYQVTPWRADSQESPSDATFPHADAIRMVREMAKVGASNLYLTGGEPLLRKDLPEIIAVATSVGVKSKLFTKFPISAALAQ